MKAITLIMAFGCAVAGWYAHSAYTTYQPDVHFETAR
jgi:hypothetical protein